MIYINYLDYVDIKQGTKSEKRFSSGNTLPLVTRPFGMNAFTIENDEKNGGFFYSPDSRSIDGVRLTHQPSPWVGDYGNLIMMPQNSQVIIDSENRWSGFRIEEIILTPNYMNVYFLRYQARFELSPTERGAKIKVTYDKKERVNRFAIMSFDYCTNIELDCENNRVMGYTKAATGGTDKNFAMYFVFEFDEPIDKDEFVITHRDGTSSKIMTSEGVGIGANIGFEIGDKNELNIKFATSYISIEQALINLEREIGDNSLEDIKKEGRENWNKYLSKIDVETETQKQRKTFYSCFYRCFIFPRKFYEYDKDENIVHYSVYTGKVEKGYMYTDNGFWDTFRTIYPLYSLILDKEYKNMLEAFINIYKESGWLPRWISPGERGIMPGTLIDAVLADAIVKDIIKDDMATKALDGMIKHANEISKDKIKGREGIEDYLKFEYLPNEKYSHSVSSTLDYIYGDFCIAQVAEKLGENEIAKEYFDRAEWYKNLFDEKTGFIRGKNSIGEINPKFNSYEWGEEYCEGSAWQGAFAVYHDILGLANLMGGKEQMIDKMDKLFASDPIYDVGAYEKEIHEMTEMAAVDFGQCAISNQPSFHLPFIYACMGKPNKGNYWIRKIIDELFSSEVTGFPGDEDNGSMSAWYVLSSLGLYSFCPAVDEFIICAPSVKRACVNTVGKKLVIRTKGQGYYVKKVFKDSKIYDKLYIKYDELIKGTELRFELTKEYFDKKYKDEQLPFSLSKK